MAGGEGEWDIDKGLGAEYAANSVLGFQPDFREGVDCTVGSKRGEKPAWIHSTTEEAARDPVVQDMLSAVDKKLSLHDHLARRES